MAIHYTCDLCSKSIPIEDEVRYEINIEIKAAFDATESGVSSDADDARDEMTELLELMSELNDQKTTSNVYKLFKFDLCRECRKRYTQDPLFRQAVRRIGFSEN